MEKRKLTTRQKISKIVRGLYSYGYLKFLKGKNIGKNVFVYRSVTIDRAIILPRLKIGSHCFVGAGPVVTKEVPDYYLVAGSPAKIVRVGIELNGDYQIINHGRKPSTAQVVEHNLMVYNRLTRIRISDCLCQCA